MQIILLKNPMDVLQEEIPRAIRSKFIPIINRGYNLANNVIKEIPFLDWDLGYQHTGYLKNIAVQYAFKKETENGNLPFESSLVFNSNRSTKHLERKTGNSIITVSLVQNHNVIARHAFFRKKLQLSNQLRFNFDTINDNFVTEQPYYILITHGYGQEPPNFINVGIPDGHSWMTKINLLAEPHLVTARDDNKVKEEEIMPEQLVGFKKFVKEVVGSEK